MSAHKLSFWIWSKSRGTEKNDLLCACTEREGQRGRGEERESERERERAA